MATPNYVEPFAPYDDCICGRKMGDLHCPSCGYATVRAVVSRNNPATLPNGEWIMNRVYACRKCGRYFDTVAQMNCSAPAPRLGRPKTVLQEQVSSNELSEGQEKALKELKEIMRKRGAL